MDLREAKITDPGNIARHPWEQARKEVVVDLISNFLPEFINQEKEILDIGCGDTWLIEQIAKDIPQAKFTAVDIAFEDEMIESLRSRLDAKRFSVYKELDTALATEKKKADLILLLDVIEHIEDDIAFLKWVLTFTDYITKDTYFLITVPAFQSLFCEHDHFLGHYRRYSNSMLKKHIHSSGMEVIKLGYFFTSLLPPRWLISTLEKLKLKPKRAKGIGDWKEKATDKIIKSILLLDFKFTFALQRMGIKLPGLSNYVLCRKTK